MDIIKSSLWDIFGGAFVGKVVEFFMPNIGSNKVSIANFPKMFFIVFLETGALGYLTYQYFNWRGKSFQNKTDEMKSVLYMLGLYSTTSNYLNRVKALVNFIQGFSQSELTDLTGRLIEPQQTPGLTTKNNNSKNFDMQTPIKDHTVPFPVGD